MKLRLVKNAKIVYNGFVYEKGDIIEIKNKDYPNFRAKNLFEIIKEEKSKEGSKK